MLLLTGVGSVSCANFSSDAFTTSQFSESKNNLLFSLLWKIHNLITFAGVDWHSNPRVDHGVVTRGDTPRFIMGSIKQCRGPPKLFMLDKYDDLSLVCTKRRPES